MTESQGRYDVVVIGAGPSGSVAATLLANYGHRVLILERQHFPRFSIGESLLPQSMEFLEQAGLLQAVVEAGFQYKNGAAFCRGTEHDQFDFRKKFSDGWGTTYQVQRGQFDKILADSAGQRGVEIRYGQTVTAIEQLETSIVIDVSPEEGTPYRVAADFLLDGSGFGRVLPRLLNLEKASCLGSRVALFTHVEDNIRDSRFDRNKILITVHPSNPEIWYWLIPFSNGRSSVGVVLPRALFDDAIMAEQPTLQRYIDEGGMLSEILANALFDTPVGKLDGYSCDVARLYGERFALLGNAGEFLDPVFSSGVTIALKSATLAAAAVHRQLNGLQPDWEQEYAIPLKVGIDTFRVFVEGWYDGRLQDVIFSDNKSEPVKAMISSVLAGYAWDRRNPYVSEPARLSTLAELCRR
ncbi:FAD-dependent oxidoreductase [Marinobacterium zhoushanense]|uniref:FAD-dependent oxidoreductase n=1 Tax=Marinobacterium zhoushanense TaxID=1679163 RepID=A0ABQ1K0E3_9GAMM|nr:NAD(P)/FAD-dependent oxidoreductase [Marinobacterium zhoushanense]GGB80964.1 FAD-dependent oxidoreductase [Marinobacterium zhoushanense]